MEKSKGRPTKAHFRSSELQLVDHQWLRLTGKL